jgi:ABC-type transporter Mla maintaining outer membrane lipid asymmetry ATPase subunit MlaF
MSDTTSAVAARIQQEVLAQDHGSVGLLADAPAAVTLTDVAVDFGPTHAVRRVSFPLVANQVTALVGPSGCGKTTVLRAINRMHDRSGGKVSGSIRLGDLEIYGRNAQPELIRSRIGMVFQRPNPFPTMSIFDNVTSGLRFNGIRNKGILRDAAESALQPPCGRRSKTASTNRRCACRVVSNSVCVSPAPWPSSPKSC